MSEGAGADAARGRLEAAGAALLWSLGGVFIKVNPLPAAIIASGRSLCAGLAVLPLARRRPARSLAVVALSIVCYTIVVGLFVVTTKITTAANAIILQYTAPLFVFLIEWLRGARPDRSSLATLAGGMIGITVIWLGSAPGDGLGIGLAVLSGLFFAGWMVLAASAAEVDAVSLTAANNLGSGLLLLPFAIQALRAEPGLLRAWPLALLLLQGTLQLALPYVLFSRAVRRISAREASLLALVEPVMNPIWVALVVGEVPSRSTLLGGGIILATLALRYLGPRDRGRG